jgi:hypothetical protein
VHFDVETTQHGTTWHLRRHFPGKTTERDGTGSTEKKALEAVASLNFFLLSVYQTTIGNVSQTDCIVLHHARIDEILKRTKEHLEVFLASADVIIEHDEPS